MKKLDVPLNNYKIILLIFLILSFLIYGNSIKNDFTFDDHSHIESNVYIRSIDGIRHLAFQPAEKGDIIRSHLYRPFAYFIKYVIFKLFGIKSSYFHIINIVLYAVNCFLIFAVLKNIFEPNLAILSSLLFLLHPIHTEVVSSAISISELLASTLGFLSFYVIIKSFEKLIFIYLYPMFFLLALLSKETAIIFPLLIVIVAYLKRASSRHYTLIIALTFIPVLIFFILRYMVIGSFIRSPNFEFVFIDNPLTYFTFSQRLINSSYIMLKYISLLIMPYNLSGDYSYKSIELISNIFSVQFIISVILHISTITAAIILLKKRFSISFAILLFYIPLLPTGNILFAGGALMAERFLYLSCLSLCIGIAYVFSKALPYFPKIKYLLFLLIILISFIYGFLTHQRNYIWKNDFTLFSDVLKKYPNNAKANLNIANIYFHNKNFTKSLYHAEKALNVYPEYTMAKLLLSQIYFRLRNSKEAEKILADIIKTNPHIEIAYLLLGEMYVKEGELAKARNVFQQGTEKLPLSILLNYDYALSSLNLGEINIAASSFSKCIYLYNSIKFSHIIGNRLQENLIKSEKIYDVDKPVPLSYYLNCVKYLSYTYIIQKNYSHSIRVIESNINDPSIDKDLLLLLSYSFENLNDTQKAKDYFYKFLYLNNSSCANTIFQVECQRLLQTFNLI